jgi:hypothetical protein
MSAVKNVYHVIFNGLIKSDTRFNYFIANHVKQKCIQDVHGVDINKHWPETDIILASYWMKAGEVL